LKNCRDSKETQEHKLYIPMLLELISLEV